MNHLPEPPTASAAGQADNQLTDAIIAAAVDDAIEKAKRHGTTPQVVIGNTPPVQQEGRAAMSSKSVDDTARMLGASVVIAVTGASISAVLWSSGHADPTVIAWMAAAPPMAFFSLRALIKGVKRAAVPDVHNYSGPVYQEHHTTNTRTVWNKTINKH